MKANELRIGNWIEVKNLYTQKWCFEQVKGKTLMNMHEMPDHHLIKENIRPIHLTEEWFIAMGFKDKQDRFEKWAYTKKIIADCSIRIVSTNKRTSFFIRQYGHIKYVHEMQNLYFALTGKEIQIEKP